MAIDNLHGISNRLLVFAVVSSPQILSFGFLSSNPAFSQIVPDNTLPIPSQMTVDANLYTIEGGTETGSNLFHSFESFSIPTGSEAFFNNATTVENILTRVTGGNVSNIDGLIRANGTANLFLINPNGIVFGKNARLDLGGSFFASTAHRLEFRDGSFFSATEPNTPPFLTVSVPVGVQLGNSSGSIEIQGTGNLERFPTATSGLSVAPGRSIAFIGGNVTLDGAMVSVPSGRVEIGSVVEGNVSLDEGWTLNYDGVSAWGSVRLRNRASVFVPTSNVDNISNTGIQMVGRDISIDGSQIATLTQNSQASGNVDIQASELLTLGGSIDTLPFSAAVETQTDETATGNGGHLNVTSPQIAINDGARVQTWSFGGGNAGDVSVNADSIEIVGAAPPSVFSLDTSTLIEQSTGSRIASENFGIGGGGDLHITTDNVFLSDGGQIRTLVGLTALGRGGTITVNAREMSAIGAIVLNPVLVSGIASQTVGAGDGGNVSVSTQRASLQDGGQISTWTSGAGRGGNLSIEASESFVARGVNPFLPVIPGGIAASAVTTGDGGNIELSTPQLTLSDGAGVTSFVLVQLTGLPLPDGGMGNAGNVNVEADSIELIGTSPFNADNFTQMGSITFGAGDAGDINISTRQLTVRDGAVVLSSVTPSLSPFGEPPPGSGSGNSGRLQIDASESIEVLGTNAFFVSPSFVGTSTVGLGNAGEFVVNTDRLVLRDGGAIGTFTGATGNAGQIRINASEILISGRSESNVGVSRLTAGAFAPDELAQQTFFIPPIPTGETGEVTVRTERLTLQDGGSMSVQHEGIGNAGTLDINASHVSLEDDSAISATTAFGVGGNVNLKVSNSLQLRDDSQIALSALGDVGNGGNLSIESATVTLLDRSSIQANAVRGAGGNIRIVTEGILSAPNTTITASSQLGIDGVVEITQSTVDTNTGLIQLSQDTIDLANRIDRGCASSQGNTFVVSGRGGIPSNPRVNLYGTAGFGWSDIRDWRSLGELPSDAETRDPAESAPTDPVVEATGWQRHKDGTVELVVTPQGQPVGNRWLERPVCR
ncbi:MAG: filamentous hemagglutinin N-terminal domain-containing protein [Cyanobacteria bacterium SID2]|nr:filamentous hemagglutinin N-terminal domain-containing protein [Cyanobacteria bacterium SID2]MBP0004022.1 filamentous hemagglutinin N-terminal domain-containing protein [Cyanobacteria bacterium SBC]